MKVLMASDFGEPFVEELRKTFPDVTFQTAYTVEEQLREAPDAEVIFGWPTGEVFRAAERVRWVQCPGTGVDQLLKTTPELMDSDAVLTNSRGPHVAPMADHVFMMMLSLAHRGRQLLDHQRGHRWEPSEYRGSVVELEGATMGILALGDIGRAVARRARGFGMQVRAVDALPVKTGPDVRSAWGLDRLDELLGLSDWFVVTAPLTPESRGMIDRRRIGLLKQGAYMIVISRGGIVDEAALAEALQSGRVAGAGLDATAAEPLAADDPLWDMDNVVISPHISADSPGMYDGRRAISKENMRRFLANEPFLYVCDKMTGF